ncbi:MAG: porin, partial [Planctomycetaceae bacterium]|nr:porin [Planctomycetaceae bacterium]
SNVNATDPQVNQAVLFIEREMDASNGFDWGFRVESGFGTDLLWAQSWNDQSFDWNAGKGDYNWALSALYATVGYKNLSVKVGKFGTLMGYESFQSTGKFFVSHAYQYGIEPLSTTGILAEYALGSNVTLLAGYSMGNDTWENRFGDSQIIGGVTADLTDKLSLSYMFNVGYEYDLTGNRASMNRLPNGFGGEAGAKKERIDNYYQTFVVNYQLTDRLAYALYSNYFQSEAKGYGHGKSYGVANYLTYKLSDKWEAGFRFEWMRDELRDGSEGADGQDYYEYTLGLKWSPLKHLTVLGEVRYDQAYKDSDGNNNIFDGGRHAEQFGGGISAIISF